ncbi:MAG: hypothetical protein JWM11_6977 [Planctomycetaceae bacterium]|nr:hypothetical protein [Planctomycetaceae bacterium]
MAEELPLTDNLDSFAAAMSVLSPHPSRLNRDQLMYEAGRAAALASLAANRSSLRLWKAATTLSVLTTACLAALLIPRGIERANFVPPLQQLTQKQAGIVTEPVREIPVQKVVPTEKRSTVKVPVGPALDLKSQQAVARSVVVESPKLDLAMSYLIERNLALAGGLGRLPESRDFGAGEHPVAETYRDLLKSFGPENQ